MKHRLLPLLLLTLLACQRQPSFVFDNTPRHTQAPGYVYIQDRHFMVDDSLWFPIMMNYKIDWHVSADTIQAIPVSYYEVPQRIGSSPTPSPSDKFDDHFWLLTHCAPGVNSLRVCIDVMNSDSIGHFYNHGTPAYVIRDSARIFQALDHVVAAAQRNRLRVMFLLATPLDSELETFTAALLRHFADNPTVWAYDFMNEPLYFDTEQQRTKESAYLQTDRWRQLMNRHAPHQLFTLAFAEPTEVFSWDPSLLPVDFVEMHTYHPLRVASEMWWYGHYAAKPWMVGETALPADNDSVPHSWQCHFLTEAYQCAIDNGAAGFGWWEFMDFPMGKNFEAQYTGIFSHQGRLSLLRSDSLSPAETWTVVMQGTAKPVARFFAQLRQLQPRAPQLPSNYYNMMGYTNFRIDGTVVDPHGRPIEGAVVRGWNSDWSIAQNTFSAPDGRFRLYSNDIVLHLWISAPGMSTECLELTYDTDFPLTVFDTLPLRHLEYQQISYLPFLADTGSLLTFRTHPDPFSRARVQFDNVVGTVKLRKL